MFPALPLAFVSGSVAVFVAAGASGAAAGLHELSLEWRLGVAGFGFLLLAAADVEGLRRSSYCPLGPRRQTPRMLLRHFPIGVVSTLWGLDLGLSVTTFRVTALTWAGLLLVALGLCPWWIGFGYGLAFAIPFSILLFTHASGAEGHRSGSVDPGLERMLRRRPAMQVASVGLLCAAGWVALSGVGNVG